MNQSVKWNVIRVLNVAQMKKSFLPFFSSIRFIRRYFSGIILLLVQGFFLKNERFFKKNNPRMKNIYTVTTSQTLERKKTHIPRIHNS